MNNKKSKMKKIKEKIKHSWFLFGWIILVVIIKIPELVPNADNGCCC